MTLPMEKQEAKYVSRVEKMNNAQSIEAFNSVAVMLGIVIYSIVTKIQKGLAQREEIHNNKYNEAMNYIHNGDYITAGQLLEELGDFKDSREQYSQIISQIVQQVSIGDKIQFGNYEWQILAKENSKALIITTASVGNKQYNTTTSITWEECTLCKWLNNEFSET